MGNFLYNNLNAPQVSTFKNIQNASCLITGATHGLGLASLKHIYNLKEFSIIIILIRNKKLADEIINDLKQSNESYKPYITSVYCDLSNNDSVVQASQEIKNILHKQQAIKKPYLNLLLNNAGIMFCEDKLASDKSNLIFSTNTRGPWLLTEKLLDNLKNAKKARIVNVASGLHYAANKMDYNIHQGIEANIHTDDPYSTYIYNQSKLGNVLAACELNERLQNDHIKNVTINSCEPGMVKTQLFRDFKPLLGQVYIQLFGRNVEKGAATQLTVALDEKYEQESGIFFKNCQPKQYNQYVTPKTWKLFREQMFKNKIHNIFN